MSFDTSTPAVFPETASYTPNNEIGLYALLFSSPWRASSLLLLLVLTLLAARKLRQLARV
ncbi:hypothetical protein FY528_08135 [Hymenobacter lutimineralis]|uniref:Uncharacterized protein n=1 Tax=Hymenobacter lutimineralis TaxID=2606448 RepID=A0A5D6V7W3_9BACT|nr:hypothetical protein [Hymenobacter lutimineralis]TYZ11008.1 hypothetical protein FY528_08135 [Hymenobacter lutimineralis]